MTTFGRENRYRDVGHEITWLHRENQEVESDSPKCRICSFYTHLSGQRKTSLKEEEKPPWIPEMNN